MSGSIRRSSSTACFGNRIRGKLDKIASHPYQCFSPCINLLISRFYATNHIPTIIILREPCGVNTKQEKREINIAIISIWRYTVNDKEELIRLGWKTYTAWDNMPIEEFSARLKQRRTELGLTYQELSNRTGISAATLQRYEAGKIKKIPNTKLELLAQGLNTAIGDFMGSDIENDVLQEEKSDGAVSYTIEPVVDILELLGYSVETSQILDADPLKNSLQHIYTQEKDAPDQIWIRDTKTQKCYEMTWQQFRDLKECVTSYADFLTHRIIDNAQVIKRPTYWHKAWILNKE